MRSRRPRRRRLRQAHTGYARPVRCPECGAPLVPSGGCAYCPACGWSACG